MKKALLLILITPVLVFGQSGISSHKAYKIAGSIFHTNLNEDVRLIERTSGYVEDTSFISEVKDDQIDSHPQAKVAATGLSELQSLEGITSTYLRSDNNIAVGPNHVIQVINSFYLSSLVRVWDKSGNILIDRAQFRDLTGDYDYGDPNIIYDWEADRFIITFLFSEEDNKLIIAASETSDPTGPWYGYTFITPGGFPDYEKLARWGDNYVVTVATVNPAVYVINRQQVLDGIEELDVLNIPIERIPKMSWQTLSPIHQTGSTSLPENTPIAVARVVEGSFYPEDTVEDHLEIFEISVDWTDGGSAVLSPAIKLDVTTFDHNVCDTLTPSACLEQPETDVKIWPCPNFLMDKPQMVVIDGSIHMVCTHVVNTDVIDTTAGMRWYEIVRDPTGVWTVQQEGIQSPDNLHRFLGSISINEAGEIALGYNVVSSTEYPGFRVAVNRPCDTPGSMSEELTGAIGTAPNASNSYGDYNSLVSDPVDGSFWFNAQYNTAPQWSSRVIQFAPDSCGTASSIEYNNIFDIQLFPNPTNDNITITSNNEDIKLIEIFNFKGQIIWSTIMTQSQNIDLTSFPSGAYQVRVILDQQVVFTKTIVKN